MSRLQYVFGSSLNLGGGSRRESTRRNATRGWRRKGTYDLCCAWDPGQPRPRGVCAHLSSVGTRNLTEVLAAAEGTQGTW